MEISVPDSDYDFVGMNERFKKVVSNGQTPESEVTTNPSEEAEVGAEEVKEKTEDSTKEAYNPKKSFLIHFRLLLQHLLLVPEEEEDVGGWAKAEGKRRERRTLLPLESLEA